MESFIVLASNGFEIHGCAGLLERDWKFVTNQRLKSP
jgi:hypothetical protein